MNHLKFIFPIILTALLIIGCNKSIDVSPETKQEVLTTAKGNLIGSPITKVIGNAGGNLALPSAGANIIVPAGAMLAGASLTIQATNNPLENTGQGIQISGTWQKPIWLEFNYGLEITDPENYSINYQTSKGDWIASSKVKVDKVKRTFAIRLGQTSSPNAKINGARPSAGTYSFAASHEFYLKPDKSAIDLGESVTFTAFAKQGDTDGYWRKTKSGQYFYEDGELVPLTKPKTTAIANNDPNDEDNYLVPLTPVDKNVAIADDDELMPLTKAMNEAVFTNKKTGFTRSWILMDGPGNLNPTGNVGAKYTAPKDASAKGKTARISFFSKNDKTKQDLEASATIRIKDGLTRYTGTITYYEKTETNSGRVSACGTQYLSYEIKISAKVTLVSYLTLFTSLKGIDGPKEKISNNLSNTVEFANGYDSDGDVKSRLVGSCSNSGLGSGVVTIIFNTSTKEFDFAGDLKLPNDCEKETFNFCTNVWEKTKANYSEYFKKTNVKYTDIDNLSGTFFDGKKEITYNLVKEK